jgi:hypothetical protein
MTNFISIRKYDGNDEIDVLVAIDSIRTIEPRGLETLITFKGIDDHIITSENVRDLTKRIASSTQSSNQKGT